MDKKKTPLARRSGTRHSKSARSAASQARLDAIIGIIGDDAEGLRRLIAAIAGIDPTIIFINL